MRSLDSTAQFMPEFRRPTHARPTLRAWIGLLGVSAAAFGPTPEMAHAHAIIVAAQPAMHATVVQGDLDIRLEFNSQIDRERSRLSLRQPDGSELTVMLAGDAPANVLAGRVRATMTGRWHVDWQVLSLDGHVTRGEVSFSVRDKSSAP